MLHKYAIHFPKAINSMYTNPFKYAVTPSFSTESQTDHFTKVRKALETSAKAHTQGLSEKIKNLRNWGKSVEIGGVICQAFPHYNPKVGKWW